MAHIANNVGGRWKLLRRYLRRITLEKDQIKLDRVGNAQPTEIPIQIRTRGGETLILAPPHVGAGNKSLPNATLIKALGRAWRWRKALERGDLPSIAAVAKAASVTERYVTRILRIAPTNGSA